MVTIAEARGQLEAAKSQAATQKELIIGTGIPDRPAMLLRQQTPLSQERYKGIDIPRFEAQKAAALGQISKYESEVLKPFETEVSKAEAEQARYAVEMAKYQKAKTEQKIATREIYMEAKKAGATVSPFVQAKRDEAAYQKSLSLKIAPQSIEVKDIAPTTITVPTQTSLSFGGGTGGGVGGGSAGGRDGGGILKNVENWVIKTFTPKLIVKEPDTKASEKIIESAIATKTVPTFVPAMEKGYEKIRNLPVLAPFVEPAKTTKEVIVTAGKGLSTAIQYPSKLVKEYYEPRQTTQYQMGEWTTKQTDRGAGVIPSGTVQTTDIKFYTPEQTVGLTGVLPYVKPEVLTQDYSGQLQFDANQIVKQTSQQLQGDYESRGKALLDQYQQMINQGTIKYDDAVSQYKTDFEKLNESFMKDVEAKSKPQIDKLTEGVNKDIVNLLKKQAFSQAIATAPIYAAEGYALGFVGGLYPTIGKTISYLGGISALTNVKELAAIPRDKYTLGALGISAGAFMGGAIVGGYIGGKFYAQDKIKEAMEQTKVRADVKKQLSADSDLKKLDINEAGQKRIEQLLDKGYNVKEIETKLVTKDPSLQKYVPNVKGKFYEAISRDGTDTVRINVGTIVGNVGKDSFSRTILNEAIGKIEGDKWTQFTQSFSKQSVGGQKNIADYSEFIENLKVNQYQKIKGWEYIEGTGELKIVRELPGTKLTEIYPVSQLSTTAKDIFFKKLPTGKLSGTTEAVYFGKLGEIKGVFQQTPPPELGSWESSYGFLTKVSIGKGAAEFTSYIPKVIVPKVYTPFSSLTPTITTAGIGAKAIQFLKNLPSTASLQFGRGIAAAYETSLFAAKEVLPQFVKYTGRIGGITAAGEASLTTGLIKPTQITTPKLSASLLQPTSLKTGELTKTTTVTKLGGGTGSGTKLGQEVIQIPAITPVEAQKIVEVQQTKLSEITQQVPMIPTPPTIPYKLIPKLPSGGEKKNLLKIKKKRGPEKYIPLVKRKGKWIPFGKPTEKITAIRKGVGVLRTTLGASLQVRGVSTGEPVQFVKVTKEFRLGKTPYTLVQRAPQRLRARQEVSEIIMARRMKPISPIIVKRKSYSSPLTPSIRGRAFKIIKMKGGLKIK